MQLADGRKDLQQIRAATAERVRTYRANQSSLQGDVTKKLSQPAATTEVIPLAQSPQQIPEDDFIERARQEDARATAVADGLIAENPGLVRRLLNAIDDDFPEDLDFLIVLRDRQKKTIAPPTKAENNNYAEDDDLIARAEEDDLIKTLARSTPAVRSAAAEALIKGRHQIKFDAVTAGVLDLYTQLAKAGR
jgi:hypothetical protein